MNILFICKRYYTGKDVIRHRFGRLYEVPNQLARLGHHITILCLDYRNNDPHENFTEQFEIGSTRWTIVSLRSIYTLEAWTLYQSIKASKPDIVLGSSDIPCLWLARMLAIRMKVPYVVDLYDNYESFGQARIPGFRNILSVCIKDADITIAVSKALGKKICSDYKKCDSVLVMSNGVICSNFFKGDKRIARIELGLPLDVRLIGTAGNLSRMKGLDTVYEAFSEIVTQTEDVYLVLAGPVEKGFPVPDSPRVIYLGELLERNVGQLFRALDVGIIPAHDSEFGRYCFPQKLYEMVACELPVIAANIGALSDILQDKPEMLFKPGISEDLVKTAMHQFDRQQLTGLKVMEWGELVSDMEPLLSKLSKLGND